jgi:CheY-like chemotaxis protein
MNMYDRKSILVVDDDFINRRVMKLTLEKLLFLDVDFASDGFVAEKMVSEKNYDIILMDLHMPRQNGFETTEHIREKLFIKPILAVTAYNIDLKTCKKSGLNDLLYKPYNKKILNDKLIEWLR